jgi:integrase/recombinase XerD
MKPINKSEKSIEEAIEGYVEDAENKDLTHSTVKKRQRIPRDFHENILKELDREINSIEDIHPDHIEAYVDYRREQGVSDLTIRNEVTTIQGLLSTYNHSEFMVAFSMEDLGLDTKTNIQKQDKVPSISKDEYRKLLDGAECLRDEIIFRIGWETGVRRSEMARIDINDIKFDERDIKIKQSKSSGTRTVFFDFNTEQKLKRYIKINRRKYPNSDDLDALLVSHDGMRLSPEHINHIIADTAEKVGIQEVIGTNSKGHKIRKVTSHSLRHSFALQRLKAEMPLKMIADIMGDSPDTVADTYLETDTDDLREANDNYRPKPY